MMYHPRDQSRGRRSKSVAGNTVLLIAIAVLAGTVSGSLVSNAAQYEGTIALVVREIPVLL